jgi:hypothetical protein
VKAAYDFNLTYAVQFQANVGPGGGSSSADHGTIPPAAAPEPAVLRCNFAACMLVPTEDLRECTCGAPHHHICSINAGCEADCSLCAVCLGVDGALPAAALDVPNAEELPQSTAVEEGWRVLEGGPWIAKLMRPSRQPVAHANYRNFYLPLAFDPAITPLCPAGELKIPIVAGAPADGLVLKLPSGWSGTTRELVFKLKLNKAAATESSVTINQIFYRNPNVDADSEDSDGMLVDERSDGEAASMPASGDGSMAARAAALLSMPDEPRASGETDDAAGAVDLPLEQPPDPPLEVDVCDAEESVVDQPPAPPPAPPSINHAQPPPAPARVSQRASCKRVRFGESGEFEGAASNFKSAPIARKEHVPLAEELGVPTFALPGATVLAMGLHAGVRKRFKATVLKLRRQFPRIVVKYIEDESGGSHALELPDPVTAYVTMADVQPLP